MRAVLDPNVIISATLSPHGSPGRALFLWLEGAYELVCSPSLLDELARALAYPRLRRRISKEEAQELIDLLRRAAIIVADPASPRDTGSKDPDDRYLIALAAESRSVLVSGDRDLLQLSDRIPVYSPAGFLGFIATR